MYAFINICMIKKHSLSVFKSQINCAFLPTTPYRSARGFFTQVYT